MNSIQRKYLCKLCPQIATAFKITNKVIKSCLRGTCFAEEHPKLFEIYDQILRELAFYPCCFCQIVAEERDVPSLFVACNENLCLARRYKRDFEIIANEYIIEKFSDYTKL